jgi:hypothetical protein
MKLENLDEIFPNFQQLLPDAFCKELNSYHISKIELSMFDERLIKTLHHGNPKHTI